MKVAIETEQSPLDANLEKVLPGVHSWHKANDLAITSLGRKVETLAESVQEGFQRLVEAQSSQRAESDQRLASSFIQVATSLIGGNPKKIQTPPKFTYLATEEQGSPGDSSDGDCDMTNAELFTSPAGATKNNDILLNKSFSPSPARQPTDEDLKLHQTFRMVLKHSTLINLYAEWTGTDAFNDGFGGVEGRNRLFKAKWRKHIDPTLHSNTKRAVDGIRNFAKREKFEIIQACISLQHHFVQCNCCVGKFVVVLQKMGLVLVQKKRGRHAIREKQNNSSEEEENNSP